MTTKQNIYVCAENIMRNYVEYRSILAGNSAIHISFPVLQRIYIHLELSVFLTHTNLPKEDKNANKTKEDKYK